MLGVRETDGPSRAPAARAVAPQTARETATAGASRLLDGQQIIEGARFIAPLARNPKVSYTGRNEELRILCGSTQSLFEGRDNGNSNRPMC